MPQMSRKEEIETLLDPRVINQLVESMPGFDRAGLLAAIIESFGGQEKFGAAIVTEYHHAAPGTMVRQRILDMICRLLSQHSNVVQQKPVEEMDTDEIHQAILQMAPKLAQVGRQATVQTGA